MYDLDESWYISAEKSSLKYTFRRPVSKKSLRWCPGVYTDPNTGQKEYHDVWLYCFLEKTPFKTFDELFEHVKFEFEKHERRDENVDRQHGKDSGDT